jgi:hypothetical protein
MAHAIMAHAIYCDGSWLSYFFTDNWLRTSSETPFVGPNDTCQFKDEQARCCCCYYLLLLLLCWQLLLLVPDPPASESLLLTKSPLDKSQSLTFCGRFDVCSRGIIEDRNEWMVSSPWFAWLLVAYCPASKVFQLSNLEVFVPRLPRCAHHAHRSLM